MPDVKLSPRPVPAPEKDWLDEAEVRACLGGISSKSLYRLIKAGKFPRGTYWGRDQMWQWEDVAWFYLGKRLEARLGEPVAKPADPAADDDEDDDEGQNPVSRKPR